MLKTGCVSLPVKVVEIFELDSFFLDAIDLEVVCPDSWCSISTRDPFENVPLEIDEPSRTTPHAFVL